MKGKLLIGTHQVVDGIVAVASHTGSVFLLVLVAIVEPLGGTVCLQARFIDVVFLFDAFSLGGRIAALICNSGDDVFLANRGTAIVTVIGKDDQFGYGLFLVGSAPLCPFLDVGDASPKASCHVRPRCRIGNSRAHNSNAVAQHQFVLSLRHFVSQLLHHFHQMGIVGFLNGDIAATKVNLSGLQPLGKRAIQNVLALDEHHLRLRCYFARRLTQAAHQCATHRRIIERTQHSGRHVGSHFYLQLIDHRVELTIAPTIATSGNAVVRTSRQ